MDKMSWLDESLINPKCTQCDFENPEGTLVFCENCGFPLDMDIEFETFNGLPNLIDRTTDPKMIIDKRSEKSIYITIGDYTYYIDDSTNEQIINKWKHNDNPRIFN
tara:strand:+ start:177 stop:494 length:318 start_codon:yes stop_codon:yes gene_type:complete